MKPPSRITRRAYQNFARTFIDLFWAAAMTKQTWSQYVHMDEAAKDFLAKYRNQGAVWVTPHFGNFEFMGLIWGYMDV